MPKFFDIDQNTDEWLQMRSGHITGSAIKNIMANYGKAFGMPAKRYAKTIANEIVTGNYYSDGYSNAHMERGHIQEPIARELYEMTTFNDVSNGGFFDAGLCGCSPDGLVGKNGLIEIKSVIPHVHISTLERQAFDPDYKWQIMFNLKVTGREWIDFISYCEYVPESKQLFIDRVYAKNCETEFQQIDTRINEFKVLIDKSMELLK